MNKSFYEEAREWISVVFTYFVLHLCIKNSSHTYKLFL